MQTNMLKQGLIPMAAVIAFLVLSLASVDEVMAAMLTPGDIVLDEEGGTIILIDGETGAQTVVSSGGVLDLPQGLTIDAGHILVVDLCVQSVAPGVVRINPATGAQTIVTMGGLLGSECRGGPAHIALEPDGQILVTGNFLAGTNNNQIIRIDPVTGDQTLVPLIGTLPSTPRGLAVVPIPPRKKK